MTIEINGTDIVEIIRIAGWVGSIIAMLAVGLIVYLVVRPPRHVRERRRRGAPPRRELGPSEAEQLSTLVDRMEARLAVLERAIGEAGERRDQHGQEPDAPRRENGGIQ